MSAKHLVIVVGAGPAGLAVANIMSKQGHEVVVLNRDIKFGGLAEYGIFPNKHKLRGGLRKGYWEILTRPNVHYFGNLTVGLGAHVTVAELRALGPSALVFSTGAQGTKTIGVEGDTATGVYHAKDCVYHYNLLPRFSTRPFEMGQRVAVIGIGDVMVDIAHWLARRRRVAEVHVIVRRGPAERKYNPKEIRAVCALIDQNSLDKEIARIGARMEAVGQTPEKVLSEMRSEFTKCEPPESQTRMYFHFLSSPKRIRTDAQNRVTGLELEDTKLEAKGADTAAVGLKTYYSLPCDSVVFAVGDRVDEEVGLPYKNGVFVTNPHRTSNDPDDSLFQAYDEAAGVAIPRIFLCGWARKASEGLVGVAKRDGEWCSEVVTRYLVDKQPPTAAELSQKLRQMETLLKERQPDVVQADDLVVLSQMEQQEGQRRDIEEFKFPTNEEMLTAIRKNKSCAKVPASR
ncbi:MAG TPA: FAD-dependent oxidoreductase [Nitrospirales bacterium]|nr:FAD-dependent oxidoreductase [Nitrospirales bacterium]